MTDADLPAAWPLATHSCLLRSPIETSFRVRQVAGMFDLPLASSVEHEISAQIPRPGGDWRIGAIVGPSGSGKSTLVRKAYGECLHRAGDWSDSASILDGFPAGVDIKEISAALTSVGFSSPPAWLRPFRTLSNGEQFRCELALALLQHAGRLVAFDEYSSVVDRTVAQIGSAAVAKAVRRSPAGTQFVAVTCHYDVLDWLCPDWYWDFAAGRLARGALRRPPISPAAACFVATVRDRPAAFCAALRHFGKTAVPLMKISRLVVLPDFQGIGLGRVLLNTVAANLAARKRRVRITSGHPAMLALLRTAPEWRIDSFKRFGQDPKHVGAEASKRYGTNAASFRASAAINRITFSAEFIG